MICKEREKFIAQQHYLPLPEYGKKPYDVRHMNYGAIILKVFSRGFPNLHFSVSFVVAADTAVFSLFPFVSVCLVLLYLFLPSLFVFALIFSERWRCIFLQQARREQLVRVGMAIVFIIIYAFYVSWCIF